MISSKSYCELSSIPYKQLDDTIQTLSQPSGKFLLQEFIEKWQQRTPAELYVSSVNHVGEPVSFMQGEVNNVVAGKIFSENTLSLIEINNTPLDINNQKIVLIFDKDTDLTDTTNINSLPEKTRFDIQERECYGGTLFAYCTLSPQDVETIRQDEKNNIKQAQIDHLCLKFVEKLRDRYTAKAYTRLFNAPALKSIGDDILSTSHFSEVYTHLEKVSADNISILKTLVSGLSESEKEIEQTILETPFRFKHQSNALLEKEDAKGKTYFNNLSNLKLHEKKEKIIKETTSDATRESVGNDDFVFFSLEVLHKGDLMIKGLDLKMDEYNDSVVHKAYSGAFYGKTAYTLEENHPLIKRGYITFTDHTVGQVRLSSNVYSKDSKEYKCDPYDIKSRFPIVFSERVNNTAAVIPKGNPKMGGYKRPHNPIFCVRDMKHALSLKVIQFLRQSKDENFKTYIKENISDKATVDILINVLLQPEFHIPGIVSTYQYSKENF